MAGAGSVSGFVRNLDHKAEMEGLSEPELELSTFPIPTPTARCSPRDVCTPGSTTHRRAACTFHTSPRGLAPRHATS